MRSTYYHRPIERCSMNLQLIMVGKTEGGHVTSGLAHYLERIGRSARVKEVLVAESRRKEPEARKEEEGQAILKAIGPSVRVVLLDETGTLLSSPAFAEHLGRWRDRGVRDLAFVIGGAYGVSRPVREKAMFTLALSPMTFPHQLVRVLFAEQLYRAFTLLEGRKYHHV